MTESNIWLNLIRYLKTNPNAKGYTTQWQSRIFLVSWKSTLSVQNWIGQNSCHWKQTMHLLTEMMLRRDWSTERKHATSYSHWVHKTQTSKMSYLFGNTKYADSAYHICENKGTYLHGLLVKEHLLNSYQNKLRREKNLFDRIFS